MILANSTSLQAVYKFLHIKDYKAPQTKDMQINSKFSLALTKSYNISTYLSSLTQKNKIPQNRKSWNNQEPSQFPIFLPKAQLALIKYHLNHQEKGEIKAKKDYQKKASESERWKSLEL